jgi:hypothetical protein
VIDFDNDTLCAAVTVTVTLTAITSSLSIILCGLLCFFACSACVSYILHYSCFYFRKTETTKIIMAFLAKVSSLNRKRDSLGTIQCNVLEANTILDAVGNARTMRNDNSSRFGKYVKLHFDPAGELVGAGMDTFLLETTRVVRRNEDEERNFHIFYLLCSETDEEQRRSLKLRSPDTYTYLNSSGVYDRRDGVKDSDMLALFKTSMTMLNIEPDDMQSLLRCFMAILTVGNVQFVSRTTTAGTVDIKVTNSSQQYLSDTAELLEISSQDLLGSFTSRTMTVAGETLSVPLTSTQAEEVRDVFAKTLYSAIFAWIIEFLNVQLSTDDHSFDSYALSTNGLPKTRRMSVRASSRSIKAGIDQFGSRIRSSSEASSTTPGSVGMIGILDIFGFEKQAHNGLEQLLINYANETLQKQYDEVMIDAEQAFYASENISWDFIQFPSNKDCIDLISNKMSSVLTLLDEACLAPSGSDSSFIRQVYTALSKHKRLHLTSRIQGHKQFGIKHYAGTVIYSVADFVKKNKNEIFPLDLLKISENHFVTRIGQSADIEGNKTGSSASTSSSSSSSASERTKHMSSKNSKKFLIATISNSFKKSVAQLIETLQETQAHYVKCIKPNSLNVKSNFMTALVSEQLRCNGIMQTIVVTRCGYPIRFTYEHFNDRYSSLMRALSVGKECSISAGVDAIIDRLREALASGEIVIRDSVTSLDSVAGLQKSIKKSGSSESLNNSDLQGWGIQRGKTRVFLRYNEYGALEKMHDLLMGVLATRLQSAYRGYKCVQVFRTQKQAAVKISRAYVHYHNNLILMTSVLIMQDFFRNIVMRQVKRKKQAGVVIANLFYRYQSEIVKMVLLRKSKAILTIHKWWKNTAFYTNSVHRVFMRRIFAPIIIPLQRAARVKVANSRRIREISKYRISIAKTSPSKQIYTTPKKLKNEAVWHNGSPGPVPLLYEHVSDSASRDPVSCRDLLRANSQILWTIFVFYSKEKATIPGNSTSIAKRNSTHLVAASGMISLLKDWSLCPSLSSQYKANKLLKEELMCAKSSSSQLFSFTQFLSFISKLASSYYKENDARELTDKIKLLDDQFHWTEEVIALKHLLTIMNTSDGRTKFSQARNAGLIPSFVGVDGSEEALLVYLETQTSSSQSNSQSIQHGNLQKDIIPTFREVEMSDAVQLLMRKNESTLISLALRYCSSSAKTATPSTPGSKKESRKSHVVMPIDAVFSVLLDFEVCPILCRCEWL